MHPDSMPEHLPLVLYHASCNDGFCAAWLFWRYVNANAEFVAVQYGDLPPGVAGRVVVLLDFIFRRSILEKMKSESVSLTVYDHHQTAKEELSGIYQCHFDMKKSGARLFWDIGIRHEEPAPWLVDYTEDRDLWLWKLPFSREVSAALSSYRREFEVWDQIYESGKDRLVIEGQSILRYQNQVVESAVQHAIEIEMAGHKVLEINATCLVSEITQELAKSRPFGVSWFVTENKTVCSLRSAPDGLDVSEIGRAYGGGGHKHAAGFSLK